MKKKSGLLSVVIAAAVIALAFVGYNVYRHPAMFLNLSDGSLEADEVEALRAQIAAQEEKKVLVAYFSYSGNTQRAAEALREQTGADLFEISVQEEYSNVYMQSNSQIRSKARPALSKTVENMEEYDIVFIGYPVNSFLESYDLTGKLAIPFCTSGGSDIEETMPTFLDSCEGIAVYGARRISSPVQIAGWLEELNLNLGNV